MTKWGSDPSDVRKRSDSMALLGAVAGANKITGEFMNTRGSNRDQPFTGEYFYKQRCRKISYQAGTQAYFLQAVLS